MEEKDTEEEMEEEEEEDRNQFTEEEEEESRCSEAWVEAPTGPSAEAPGPCRARRRTWMCEERTGRQPAS